MNNRRSFLKMLGLGAVVALAAVKAMQAEAAPVSAVAVNAKYRAEDEARYGYARDLIKAQREFNRRHSTLLSIADPSHTHSWR